MPQPIDHEVRDLEELLDQLAWSADIDNTRISVKQILAAVGTRSFGPLLMLAGALVASPLSGIPGFPSINALIVVMVSLQLLIGRRHFWLPPWLVRRTVSRDRLVTAIRWLRPSARFIDRFIRPRLVLFVKGPVPTTIIALICLLIATVMPALELIPFSSSLAGVVLAAFGLALVSRDGILALAACLGAGGTFWVGFEALIF